MMIGVHIIWSSMMIRKCQFEFRRSPHWVGGFPLAWTWQPRTLTAMTGSMTMMTRTIMTMMIMIMEMAAKNLDSNHRFKCSIQQYFSFSVIFIWKVHLWLYMMKIYYVWLYILVGTALIVYDDNILYLIKYFSGIAMRGWVRTCTHGSFYMTKRWLWMTMMTMMMIMIISITYDDPFGWWWWWLKNSW